MDLFYFVTKLFVLIRIPGIRARTKYYESKYLCTVLSFTFPL